MDQPGVDEREHGRALAALGRLNLASGTCRQLWRRIAAFAGRRRRRRLRVLDVASGGGDVAFGLWKTARRHGVELEIVGLDFSPTACQFAAKRCEGAGPAIQFRTADVVHHELPGGFDVAVCSLFLHHLSLEEAAALLRTMVASAELTLVSDLRRCAAGYVLAWAACRLATRSPLVRADGPQSVRNAFSLTEMRELCDAARLPQATVERVWPCRLLVQHWRRS